MRSDVLISLQAFSRASPAKTRISPAPTTE
jgi:hypothetical protein